MSQYMRPTKLPHEQLVATNAKHSTQVLRWVDVQRSFSTSAMFPLTNA